MSVRPGLFPHAYAGRAADLVDERPAAWLETLVVCGRLPVDALLRLLSLLLLVIFVFAGFLLFLLRVFVLFLFLMLVLLCRFFLFRLLSIGKSAGRQHSQRHADCELHFPLLPMELTSPSCLGRIASDAAWTGHPASGNA